MALARWIVPAVGATALISLAAAPGTSAAVPDAGAAETCFERLDNGVDLTGWVRSTTNHHGPAEGWTVEAGALTGRQTAGQRGGILMTTRSYQDVEVLFEVKIDWGCDSGMFFRTTGGDRAYQVNVDHLEGGGIGTIWGESLTSELRARDYTLTDHGRAVIAEPCRTPIFDLSRWSSLWDPTGFNELRVRVEGNPPRIRTWISGVEVMDFTDGTLRPEVDAAGPLALQVHSGARWAANGAVRFRNIRARDLSVACGAADGGVPPEPDPMADGGGGGAGDRADAATCVLPSATSGCSCEVLGGAPRRSRGAVTAVLLVAFATAAWSGGRRRARR